MVLLVTADDKTVQDDLTSARGSVAAVSSAMKPVRLRCEYFAEPQGIDETAPRLSWQLVSDQRGAHQTAWRVLVASSLEQLEQNVGDLWDSGRVVSGDVLHIPY